MHAIVHDEATSNISEIAFSCELPVSTAHRLAATLLNAGYLTSAGRGRYVAGPILRSMAHAASPLHGIVALARPVLTALARRTCTVAHLGVLEDEMVKYLYKTGPRSEDFFTREGMQLEAYSSGVGKILLANLPPAELDFYLAGGPFVALTPKTIIDPEEIRLELQRVRELGFARDDFEVASDLNCLAVPLRWKDGRVHAAISVSLKSPSGVWSIPDSWLAWLRAAAGEIDHKLGKQESLGKADSGITMLCDQLRAT